MYHCTYARMLIQPADRGSGLVRPSSHPFPRQLCSTVRSSCFPTESSWLVDSPKEGRYFDTRNLRRGLARC